MNQIPQCEHDVDTPECTHPGWMHAKSLEEIEQCLLEGIEVYDRDGDDVIRVYRERDGVLRVHYHGSYYRDHPEEADRTKGGKWRCCTAFVKDPVYGDAHSYLVSKDDDDESSVGYVMVPIRPPSDAELAEVLASIARSI